MAPTPASIIYPELPDPLTPGDLQQLFSPSFDERQWAPTVVRATASQVALLVQLKIFQSIGRFRSPAEIPDIAIEHVARRMGVEFQPDFPERTRYRHRQAIFKRLGVISWGPEALALTKASRHSRIYSFLPPMSTTKVAHPQSGRLVMARSRHWKRLPDTCRLANQILNTGHFIYTVRRSAANDHDHYHRFEAESTTLG